MTVKIRWAPGHTGIIGNEATDIVVKEAAEGHVSAPKEVPLFLRKALPQSKSVAKQAFMVAVKATAREAWNVAPQSRHLQGIVSIALPPQTITSMHWQKWTASQAVYGCSSVQ